MSGTSTDYFRVEFHDIEKQMVFILLDINQVKALLT